MMTKTSTMKKKKKKKKKKKMMMMKKKKKKKKEKRKKEKKKTKTYVVLNVYTPMPWTRPTAQRYRGNWGGRRRGNITPFFEIV